MSGFLAGLCPHCGTYWTAPYALGRNRQTYCSDACRKNAYKARVADKGGRSQPQEYAHRRTNILAQIAAGELTLTDGNRCATCDTVVTVDTEPLTGRTWERCACGFHWIGKWRSAA